MKDILLETSNFTGDIILENFEFDGEYDHLFKNIRKAIKNRGMLGGLGQITGLSTNKGAARRAERKVQKAERKEDRNERKNLLADAKAAVKQSKAEVQLAEAASQTSQANLVESVAQEQAQGAGQGEAVVSPKKDNTMMYAGIGGGVLLLIVVLAFVLMRNRSKPV